MKCLNMAVVLMHMITTCCIHLATTFSIKPLSNEIIPLQPDGSANSILCQLLNNVSNKSHQQLVRLDGFVSKRRAIGKSLVFLDIVPSAIPQLETHQRKQAFAAEDFASMKPVQALMRRDVWRANEVERRENLEVQFDMYQKIIQPGVYCSLIGVAGPSRLPNESLLFCNTATYRLPNDNPQHLRNVIQFARDGILDFDEVCSALPCMDNKDLLHMLCRTGEETIVSSGECAAEILSRFPRHFLLNPSRLMGNSNTAKVALLPPVPIEYKPPLALFSKTLDDFSSDIATTKQVIAILQKSKTAAASTSMQQFTFTGWVQNRRRFQDSISVVEIVDTFSSSSIEVKEGNDMTRNDTNFLQEWSERVHIVLDPSLYTSTEMYGNILAPGSQVMIHAHITRAEESGVYIGWVSNCRLLRSSWKLNAVRQILESLHENKMPVDEAAEALPFEGGYFQSEQIASGTTTGTDRQWMAVELSQALQGEHSRYGKITSAMSQSLERFSSLRHKYPIEAIDVQSVDTVTRGELDPVEYSKSIPGRTARSNSRWERAKKPQLIWMSEAISDVLRSHPEYGQRTLKIVDIGGGKGLLSNLLAETVGDVEVEVVDISRSATNNGLMRARRRGIENVRYNAQDAATMDVKGIDCVVALHACGALSDVALGHAVSQGSAFVVCPCCFKSNPHLGVPTLSEKNSGNPLITVEEWLQVEPEFYEPLKQTAELQGDVNIASMAMHSICALRASSVCRTWRNKKWPELAISTSIKSFPIGLSTRNLCLVGKFIPS